MGCACGVQIPLAGNFGPAPGPGLPPVGSIGSILGAGAISTDTRLGGSASSAGGMAAGVNYLDWQKHPIALVLLLVLLALFVRRVVA